MVCTKTPETEHDFSKDPIQPVIVGDWLKARGTTLGADNGLGLAAILAILEVSGWMGEGPPPPLPSPLVNPQASFLSLPIVLS